MVAPIRLYLLAARSFESINCQFHSKSTISNFVQNSVVLYLIRSKTKYQTKIVTSFIYSKSHYLYKSWIPNKKVYYYKLMHYWCNPWANAVFLIAVRYCYKEGFDEHISMLLGSGCPLRMTHRLDASLELVCRALAKAEVLSLKRFLVGTQGTPPELGLETAASVSGAVVEAGVLPSTKFSKSPISPFKAYRRSRRRKRRWSWGRLE